ncbi:hypothetical protein V1509DRAFT_649410 [Lipomyces kononenkoae]
MSFVQRLQTLHEYLRAEILYARAGQSEQYDRHHRPAPNFKVGQEKIPNYGKEAHLGDDDCNYDVTGRTAVIRHTSVRGGSRRHDFNDFSLSEEDRILETVDEHRANFRKGKLMITFKISAIKEAPTKQKRSADGADTISSSPLAPPEKKRPGDRLQDQHTARLDAIRIAGDFQRQLMERWRCRDDNCANKNNFCFPEPADPSRHYNITAPQREMWSNSIASALATIQLPIRENMH